MRRPGPTGGYFEAARHFHAAIPNSLSEIRPLPGTRPVGLHATDAGNTDASELAAGCQRRETPQLVTFASAMRTPSRTSLLAAESAGTTYSTIHSEASLLASPSRAG